MRYLSFDIGIKNLAFCDICHGETTQIIDWNVLNISPNIAPRGIKIKKPSFHDVAKELMSQLNTQFKDSVHEYDCVLIENQPVQKNPVMKSIQIMVYSFFLITKPDIDIRFVSASNKLKIKHQPDNIEEMCTSTVKYTRNKQKSVHICRHYLVNILSNHQTQLQLLEDKCKRDDLADTFCQAMYIIEQVK
jgi:hypothetical protein